MTIENLSRGRLFATTVVPLEEVHKHSLRAALVPVGARGWLGARARASGAVHGCGLRWALVPVGAWSGSGAPAQTALPGCANGPAPQHTAHHPPAHPPTCPPAFSRAPPQGAEEQPRLANTFQNDPELFMLPMPAAAPGDVFKVQLLYFHPLFFEDGR
jgi:hypothetical protein